MTQGEILEFLENQFKMNSKRYFTAKEMAEALEVDVNSCRANLKQLRKNREVEYRKGERPSSGGVEPWEYRHKNLKDFFKLKCFVILF